MSERVETPCGLRFYVLLSALVHAVGCAVCKSISDALIPSWAVPNDVGTP